MVRSVITNIYSLARKLRVNRHRRSVVIPTHILRGISFMIVAAVPAFCTSGVVIVTTDFVVLGTDSALKYTNAKGVTTRTSTGCKIMKEGNIFYFLVGEYSYPSLHFNLPDIAEKAIIKAGKVKTIFSAVEPPVLAAMPSIVEYNRIASPSEYKSWLDGRPLISMVFVSFEDNTPIATYIEFIVDAKGRPVKPIEKTMKENDPFAVETAAFGYNEGINNAMDSPYWAADFRSNPIRDVKNLIQIEIDASIREKRFDVGPPISILWVSKNSSGMAKEYEGYCH